jgi:folate-dependent phosphoribosylglycinamide formyltransferase PurN
MHMNGDRPTAVLICHEQDRLDTEGLASWLASTLRLGGLILIRDTRGRLWRASRREIRRIGWLRFLDVIAFRAYARLRLAAADNAWKTQAVAGLRARYPADLTAVPTLVVSSPNSAEAREFMAALQPDIAIARCKVILKREVFEIPRAGTFVMHPGICPEYRNAHGCFWALVNRDLERVGMTLLKVDAGIDTGPVYLHGTCDIDEVRESHTVIQHRAVIENLDTIGRILFALCNGEQVPSINTEGRHSATWGQPRLTKYLRWRWNARRASRRPQGSGPRPEPAAQVVGLSPEP